MPNLKVNQVALGLILIFIIGILFYTNIINLPLSLISHDMVYNISGISPSWHTTITVDRGSSILTYMLKPQEYTYQNNTKIIPKENISLTIMPQQPLCLYKLDVHYEPVVLGVNLNLWKYYTAGNPELTHNVEFRDAAGTQKILDATQIGNFVTIQDKDGKGVLTITPQGYLSGKSSCPDASGLRILDNKGIPKVVDAYTYHSMVQAKIQDCLILCVTPYTCINCFSNFFDTVLLGKDIPTASNFRNEFDLLLFDTNKDIKTNMKGSIPATNINRVSNPVFLITADGEYVESMIYTPTPVVKPQIINIYGGDTLSGKTTTIRIVIKNAGDTPASFFYTINTQIGTIQPSSGNTNIIQPNSEEELTFVYNAPSVSSNTQYTINFKLCSGNEYGGNCITKTINRNIEKAPDIPNPINPPQQEYCGDKKCSSLIGENSKTCPTDCPPVSQPQQTCNNIPNSELKNNECVCKAGYVKRYDTNTGAMKCEKQTENWNLLYFAVGFSTIILLYTIYNRMKGVKK